MKDLFLRFCRWALPLLGVSATISCDNVIESPDMYGCPPAEYGTPTMEFRVTGKVTDSQSGDPVKGIAVSCDDDWGDPEVITSETGEFVYEMESLPSDNVKLKFTDIDYTKDGAYMPSELDVKLTKVQDGDGSWHMGYFIADDIVVKLDEELPCEYGTPIAEFSVKGRVVDSDKNPVPNIEVSKKYGYEKVRTNENGVFLYSGREITTDSLASVELQFTDTDGAENGGEFEQMSVDVPLKQVDPGDGGWDMGDYDAEDVEIVLEKKSVN